jgi:hypothetical protein
MFEEGGCAQRAALMNMLPREIVIHVYVNDQVVPKANIVGRYPSSATSPL